MKYSNEKSEHRRYDCSVHRTELFTSDQLVAMLILTHQWQPIDALQHPELA
jgi:hypothetical protein